MEHFITSEITRIDVGILDAKSKCRFTNYKSKRPGGGYRGEIRELSRQSRSRLLYKARNLGDLTHMITFTYPSETYALTATGGDYMTNGRVVKDHLRKLRQILIYRGFYGFWFLEFQKRGAPHFHFFCHGSLTDNQVLKLKKTWYKMVGTQCPYHQDMGVKYEQLRKKHAAGAYAAKYSTKDEQKIVPEQYRGVGRFWGLFGKIPKETATIHTNAPFLYQVSRVARNWAKNEAKAKGYRVSRTRSGRQGDSLYNCAPVIRAFLARHYTNLENPTEIVLSVRRWPNIPSEYPLSGDTEGINAPPF